MTALTTRLTAQTSSRSAARKSSTTINGRASIVSTAILLAGNGHVRSDRGVPRYLRARNPNAGIVAVMLNEVEGGRTDPAAYVPRDPDGKPAVDAIVFTPRAQREDSCAKMRAGMQKKG